MTLKTLRGRVGYLIAAASILAAACAPTAPATPTKPAAPAAAASPAAAKPTAPAAAASPAAPAKPAASPAVAASPAAAAKPAASPAAKPAASPAAMASPAASPAAQAVPANLPAALPKPSGVQISLVTGGTAGTYFPYGGAIANLWNQADIGVNATVEATGASVENIRLLNDKKADCALAQNDIADYAQTGAEMFKDKIQVNGVASLYPELIQVVATQDSNINSLRDLKGKRVGVGAPGSGNEANARQILDAMGLTYRDLGQAALQSYAEMAASMKDRRLDAMFITAGVPNSAITDVASGQSIKLIPVTGQEAQAIKGKYKFFADATIPTGTYPGQSGAIQTVSVQATLMCRPDLEPNVVYWLTRTLFERQQQLSAAHAKGKELSLRTALDGMTIPLHPGAKAFYDQVGVRQQS